MADKKTGLDELILKVEKMDGKLDVIDDFRKHTDERITVLAEDIGEMRSMLLEREKSFDKMEAGFDKIKEIFEELAPDEIAKKMEKRERFALENRVRVEKMENMLDKFSKEAQELRDILKKIKGFENLVDILKEVDKKVAEIGDTRRYADRLASKVEKIYGDLSKKFSEFGTEKLKIDKTSILVNEMTQSMDEMGVKFGSLVKKEDIEKLKTSLASSLKMTKIPKELINKIDTIRKATDELAKRCDENEDGIKTLVETSSPAGLKKSVESFEARLDEELEKLKERFEKNEGDLNRVNRAVRLIRNDLKEAFAGTE